MKRSYGVSWAAGAFDGEGCIVIQPHKYTRKGKIVCYYGLRIAVTNTDHRMVKRFFKIFGGRIYSYSKKSGRNAWKWYCSARVAQKVLEELLPYLIVKKEEAITSLEFMGLSIQSNRRDNQPTERQLRGREFHDKLIDIRYWRGRKALNE